MGEANDNRANNKTRDMLYISFDKTELPPMIKWFIRRAGQWTPFPATTFLPG